MDSQQFETTRVLQSNIARQQMLFINHELASKQYAFAIAIAVAFHIVSKFEYFWSFDLGTWNEHHPLCVAQSIDTINNELLFILNNHR